ncbi:hypothetical protein [Klebsiella oxytoca]|nr:hypothetical protein [Klebsiella oxytoca]
MQTRRTDARWAQPEGYFMLRKSAGKVTDWLRKSITVTVFRSPPFL